jgi:hypothetical protein
MIDLSKLARRLDRSSDPITREHYNEWKSNHVTQAFLASALESLLSDLDSPLPDDILSGLPAAYRNDGAKRILSDLLDWEPDFEEEGDD